MTHVVSSFSPLFQACHTHSHSSFCHRPITALAFRLASFKLSTHTFRRVQTPMLQMASPHEAGTFFTFRGDERRIDTRPGDEVR